MAAFTVRTPEAGWTGEVGGIQFTDGVAVIDDQTHPTVLAYCRTAGYQVEPIEPEPEPEAPKRTRASATKKTDDKEGAGE